MVKAGEVMMDITTPWFLLLLPFPYLIFRFTKSSSWLSEQALKLPFYQDWIEVSASQHTESNHRKWRLFLLSTLWLLLVLGLSDLRFIGKSMNIAQKSRAIMMAVDISESMMIQDMEEKNQLVTRLEVVKKAGEDFIKNRVGDRLGLILFGERAYLQTPLTLDRKTVDYMLQDATIGLAGLRTALGDAIGLAIKQLIQDDKNNRVLVLLTDGASNAGTVLPLEAAKMAEKNNIKIYTIGFGRQQPLPMVIGGIPVMMPTGNALDEGTLQKIADMTNGKYFRAQNAKELEQVYKILSTLEPVSAKDAVLHKEIPLYPWLLLLAMAGLFMLVFREMDFSFKNQGEQI